MRREIPVSVNLQQLFELPDCDALALPKPQPLKVRLPNGGTLTAIADLSKGIPNDCSLSANLLLQIAPFLASIECLLKVLGLIKPLTTLLQALVPPNPVKALEVLPDFLKAVDGLKGCLLMIVPGGQMFGFLKDLLLLIIKLIKCLIGQLETILGIMQGIELKIGDAERLGNTELVRALNCAKKNAQRSAEHSQQSMEPVINIVGLVQPFLEIANIKLAIPAIGSAEDSAALAQTIQNLKDVVTNVETILETLP